MINLPSSKLSMDARHYEYEVKFKFLKWLIWTTPVDLKSNVLLSNRRHESIPSSQLACYLYILYICTIQSFHSFLLSVLQFLILSIYYIFETLSSSSNLLYICNFSFLLMLWNMSSLSLLSRSQI